MFLLSGILFYGVIKHTMFGVNFEEFGVECNGRLLGVCGVALSVVCTMQ